MKLLGIFKGLKDYFAPEPRYRCGTMMLHGEVMEKYRVWEATQGGREISDQEKSQKLYDLEFEQTVHIFGSEGTFHRGICCSGGCGSSARIKTRYSEQAPPWMCGGCVELLQRLLLKK